MNFNELNLKNELNLALAKWGYNQPTPIQKITIPLSLENKDIFGKSQTGTGKTAAFVLPILQNLDINVKRNQALIVCPTRELAIQVSQQVKKYAFFLKNVNVALLCGGSNMRRQLQDLKFSNIVVGTPGRIADHLNRNTLKVKFLKTIVLDEADEMLKMGFKKEIDEIFSASPENVQTVLFSATMSKPVLKIAETYQNSPVKVNVNDEIISKEQLNITQYYVDTRNSNKEKGLVALYQHLNPQLSIIFSNTKAYTTKLQEILIENGIDSAVINGDKSQRERENAMKAFKTGKVNVLIATDVAARGIHVEGIDYVFNFDIPKEQESYTHRIGRTGRAGKTGTAITLVNNGANFRELKDIEKYQNHTITKLEIPGIETFTFKPSNKPRHNSFGNNNGNNRNNSRNSNNKNRSQKRYF